MNLNIRAVFLLTQAIGRASMIPRRSGRVINVASIAGLLGNPPGTMSTIAYNTSKGALVNFTRALATEWGRHNINVNALAPGFFPSKMTQGIISAVGADTLAAYAPLEAHRRRRGPEGRGAAVRVGRRPPHHRPDPRRRRRRIGLLITTPGPAGNPMATNRRIVLASRPAGRGRPPPTSGSRRSPCRRSRPGQILVRNHWLSLDPYMRGRMNEGRSYAASQALDDVMVGGTAGEVVESRNPAFAAGDQVVALPRLAGVRRVRRRRRLQGRHAARAAVGVSRPGRHARRDRVVRAEPDHRAECTAETVVVSAASGAVGSVVGQLARLGGCRAIGIAGGAEKCAYVTQELQFDACIDYKSEDVGKRLKEVAPDGVDGYFENVGGEIMDAVLPRMNAFGRIALCGLIAGYDGEPIPIRNPAWFLVSRLMLQGLHRHRAHGRVAGGAEGTRRRTSPRGRIKYRETDRARPRERAAGLPRHAQGRQLRQATGEADRMKDLNGKVAVITGAGSGFGREFARLGARDGHEAGAGRRAARGARRGRRRAEGRGRRGDRRGRRRRRQRPGRAAGRPRVPGVRPGAPADEQRRRRRRRLPVGEHRQGLGLGARAST